MIYLIHINFCMVGAWLGYINGMRVNHKRLYLALRPLSQTQRAIYASRSSRKTHAVKLLASSPGRVFPPNDAFIPCKAEAIHRMQLSACAFVSKSARLGSARLGCAGMAVFSAAWPHHHAFPRSRAVGPSLFTGRRPARVRRAGVHDRRRVSVPF